MLIRLFPLLVRKIEDTAPMYYSVNIFRQNFTALWGLKITEKSCADTIGILHNIPN